MQPGATTEEQLRRLCEDRGESDLFDLAQAKRFGLGIRRCLKSGYYFLSLSVYNRVSPECAITWPDLTTEDITAFWADRQAKIAAIRVRALAENGVL